jgi:hypothetical protein
MKSENDLNSNSGNDLNLNFYFFNLKLLTAAGNLMCPLQLTDLTTAGDINYPLR